MFFNCTERWLPRYLDDHARQADPVALRKLFGSASANRLTTVSLLNADLGQHSVRRRMVGARSIGDLSPGLQDHLQVCSTAQGVVYFGKTPGIRRYLGFTRARVSEPNSRKVRLPSAGSTRS